MTTVGGRIETYVRWARGDASLNGGFDRFKLGIGVFKRNIVEKEDKLTSRVAPQSIHNLR